VKIGNWECAELYSGTDWVMREASTRHVEIQADKDGLDIRENHSPYMGASGSVSIPAEVLLWLTAVVRVTESAAKETAT
jgi:hypothetical protein